MKELKLEKIEWVYKAKGIGIILVVIGHMFRGFVLRDYTANGIAWSL